MKTTTLAPFLFAATLWITPAVSLNAAEFYYAQTTTTQSYSTFIGPIPVGGLALNLPAATKQFNAALVTLNMPNLTLSTPTSPGAALGATIELVAPFAPGGLVNAVATIGCDTCTKVPETQTVTIVFKVPLGSTSQGVEAEWSSNGSCTVTTQTFASISAILVHE